MKKGLVIALVAVTILILAVPAAMALTDTQKTELKKLYEQEHQLRQQIVDKQAEAGIITTEDANNIKERMAQVWEYRKERMDAGDFSFGAGRGRGRGGFGRKGGCGNCPNAPQNSTTAPDQSSSTL